ncbi:MAG: NAD(P)H-hydrate epimerase, partial [Sedimentisphaerales bacterium]|nr:NAD(P)H-hydrate epimerase [Sedimentisphaerales bacterium]
ICRNMGMAITEYQEGSASSFITKLEKKLRHADLVVDAMLGTGASGELREPYGQIIDMVNSEVRTILAIDIPSGLDADTGKPTGSDAIRANCTVTFAALKKGYDYEYAVEYTGDIILGGIGISPYFLLDDLDSIVGKDSCSGGSESLD